MKVMRAGICFTLEYSKDTDELIIRSGLKTMAIRPEAFIEAVERRIDDDRYRPVTETEREKEARERSRGR